MKIVCLPLLAGNLLSLRPTQPLDVAPPPTPVVPWLPSDVAPPPSLYLGIGVLAGLCCLVLVVIVVAFFVIRAIKKNNTPKNTP